MSETKRGRGRPPKLPAGKQHGIRCILVNGELEKLHRAVKESDQPTQNDFARAAVLHAADKVLGIEPPTPGPKRKKKGK